MDEAKDLQSLVFLCKARDAVVVTEQKEKGNVKEKLGLNQSQGSGGWLAFSDRKIFPCICKFLRQKKLIFLPLRENGNLWLSRDYYESRMSSVESPTKAGSV